MRSDRGELFEVLIGARDIRKQQFPFLFRPLAVGNISCDVNHLYNLPVLVLYGRSRDLNELLFSLAAVMYMIHCRVLSRPYGLCKRAYVVRGGADIRPSMGYFVTVLSHYLRLVGIPVFLQESTVHPDDSEIADVEERDRVVHAVDDGLRELIGTSERNFRLFTFKKGSFQSGDRLQMPMNQ
jgi:hypothetical protein